MSLKNTQLLEQAWQALKNAYAPYSHFHVGAAIQTASGEIYVGCNVENAAYGSTLCAERAAIVAAVSLGALAPGGLKAVLIATETEKPCFPCGSCRQVIHEFATADTCILLSTRPGRIDQCLRHGELLPGAFGADDLHISPD